MYHEEMTEGTLSQEYTDMTKVKTIYALTLPKKRLYGNYLNKEAAAREDFMSSHDPTQHW